VPFSLAFTRPRSGTKLGDPAAFTNGKSADPIYNWSGFYIGMNGGWGSSRNRYEWTGPGLFALGYGADATGGTIGGQIGYNWQAGSWVFGLEAQGNWADLSKSYYHPTDLWSVGSKVDSIGMFTGRIGYAANNALFYVTGGAAVVNNDAWAAYRNVNFAEASNTRWGGTVGVGLEYGFTPNWSFGVKYMHAWLGNNDYAWACTSCINNWTNLHATQDLDLVTLRLTTASVASAKARWSRATDLTFYLQQTQSPGIVRGFFVPRRSNGMLGSGSTV
jgi:outer membrane immunogenic protein